MDIAKEISELIGQPESVNLEYKAVLPPAATVAQLICSFANTEGGYIVLGVTDVNGEIRINGLSDEFHAVEITRKAVDLLSPRPAVNYQYVDYQGRRLYAIKVEKSDAPVALGGREYVRKGSGSALKEADVKKSIRNTKISRLSSSFKQYRKTCTAAKAQFLDHYQSALNILDDLGSLLYPESSRKPTMNPEGKMLMRILFSSCADNFETYMSDLLFEIYLAKPETLKSEAPISVREVLECSDMQEFISSYAKKRLSKLQRGSVKGFVADNKHITALGVFNKTLQEGIEKILQIRHLYSHRNGIIDERFQAYFPSATLNAEYQMSLDEFLERFEYLVQAADAVDRAALQEYRLASFG
jgi:Putative DNA-binding domain